MQVDPRVLVNVLADIMPPEPKPPVENTAWRAIGKRVLCAVTTLPGDRWEARVLTVSGVDHETEHLGVLQSGDRLLEAVARAVFPRWRYKDGRTYAE